jgi:hypothetical protein
MRMADLVGSNFNCLVENQQSLDWFKGKSEPETIDFSHLIETGWWFQTFLFSVIYGIILPID